MTERNGHLNEAKQDNAGEWRRHQCHRNAADGRDSGADSGADRRRRDQGKFLGRKPQGEYARSRAGVASGGAPSGYIEHQRQKGKMLSWRIKGPTRVKARLRWPSTMKRPGNVTD